MEEQQITFNFLTGKISEMGASEFAKAKPEECPIAKYPKSNCKKCQGRGYVARNITHHHYQLCTCTLKHVEHNKVKKGRF